MFIPKTLCSSAHLSNPSLKSTPKTKAAYNVYIRKKNNNLRVFTSCINHCIIKINLDWRKCSLIEAVRGLMNINWVIFWYINTIGVATMAWKSKYYWVFFPWNKVFLLRAGIFLINRSSPFLKNPFFNRLFKKISLQHVSGKYLNRFSKYFIWNRNKLWPWN